MTSEDMDAFLYRARRRQAARGQWRVGRKVLPGITELANEEMGAVVARLRARCGACGKKVIGEFVRHEGGTVWESVGRRLRLDSPESGNYQCRDHGGLEYNRDNLDQDLDLAQRRPDGTRILRLPPGSPMYRRGGRGASGL